MFEYPPATLVNRVIPKTKILENARPTARLKALLTQEIQQIRWHAKLSPETVKLAATPQVPEIQIFHLKLKGPDIHTDLLQLLDRTIPQPILFELENADGLLAHSAAHKRPSEADVSQWVTGPRFTASFGKAPATFPPLPTALDLGRLYAALLAPLLPLAARKGESLPGQITRCDQYQSQQRKLAQLTAKVNREKQFNRRVALNQELNALKAELGRLS
ncbi:MAG: DUF4391 domain-containing protein [Verrucomicrobiota bacterium JB025]|nr:DUF4391 domain-containing protein [Verrucomicrobiota bacterium JB025]